MRTKGAIGRTAAVMMVTGLLVWPSMIVHAETDVNIQSAGQQVVMAQEEISAAEGNAAGQIVEQGSSVQDVPTITDMDPASIENALQITVDQQAIIEQALQDHQTYIQNVQAASAGQIEASVQEAQAVIAQQQSVIEQLIVQQQTLLIQQNLLHQLTQQLLTAEEELSEEQNIVFVGDSRTVQMKNAVGDNPYVWIAKISQGYKWFSETAVPQVDAVVENGTKVVINLGVNDVANVDKYARLVNEKAAAWIAKGATVYYASVNPVKDGEYIRRSMVPVFNSRLKKLLTPDIQWIDSYSYLETAGYSLPDGLHYDKRTYNKLYDYYLSHIL